MTSHDETETNFNPDAADDDFWPEVSQQRDRLIDVHIGNTRRQFMIDERLYARFHDNYPEYRNLKKEMGGILVTRRKAMAHIVDPDLIEVIQGFVRWCGSSAKARIFVITGTSAEMRLLKAAVGEPYDKSIFPIVTADHLRGLAPREYMLFIWTGAYWERKDAPECARNMRIVFLDCKADRLSRFTMITSHGSILEYAAGSELTFPNALSDRSRVLPIVQDGVKIIQTGFDS